PSVLLQGLMVSNGLIYQGRQLLSLIRTQAVRQSVFSVVGPFTSGKRDPPGVFPAHHFREPRLSEPFHCVLYQFTGNPSSSHLVRHRSGRTRTSEHIQNNLTRIAGDVDNAL